jgi:CheY-like chemotaxis protein
MFEGAMTDDKVNILLVDDQPAKLLTYEAILRDLGENLISANSAREALEHLLKKDVAVVLVDVYMPDTDGFELAAMIREHPRFRETASSSSPPSCLRRWTGCVATKWARWTMCPCR